MFDLSALLEALNNFYHDYGYLSVFLGTLSENTALLGLIMPGNSIALLGAMYARTGTLNIGWVIFFAWIGTVLGYHTDYLLGRFVLKRVMAGWRAGKLGQRFRIAARLRLSRRMLMKNGGKAILISHIAGHMRSFVALSAGLIHMRYWRFLLFEMIAAFIWSCAYCLLGYVLAGEIERAQTLIAQFSGILFGVVVMLILLWLIWRRKKRSLKSRKRKIALRMN